MGRGSLSKKHPSIPQTPSFLCISIVFSCSQTQGRYFKERKLNSHTLSVNNEPNWFCPIPASIFSVTWNLPTGLGSLELRYRYFSNLARFSGSSKSLSVCGSLKAIWYLATEEITKSAKEKKLSLSKRRIFKGEQT